MFIAPTKLSLEKCLAGVVNYGAFWPGKVDMGWTSIPLSLQLCEHQLLTELSSMPVFSSLAFLAASLSLLLCSFPLWHHFSLLTVWCGACAKYKVEQLHRWLKMLEREQILKLVGWDLQICDPREWSCLLGSGQLPLKWNGNISLFRSYQRTYMYMFDLIICVW